MKADSNRLKVSGANHILILIVDKDKFPLVGLRVEDSEVLAVTVFNEAVTFDPEV